jgi:hypothetical protein
MQLKDFIQQTIKEISEGLQESHAVVSKEGNGVDDSQNINIEFDVAVLSEDHSSDSSGAKLSVASMISLGHDAENKFRSQHTNRIKFSVMLHVKTEHHSNWSIV